MAKLFSWLKFGKRKDDVMFKPGAGSPPPHSGMTPPVEEREASMKAATKAPTKSTGAKTTTAKKTTATPAAKSAGTGAKKTSSKKK